MKNPNTRKWFYLIAGLVAALIPILTQAGVIPVDQGDAWVAALASLAGGGAALTAAHHTNQQVKSGLHDPPLNPIDQVLEAIPQVLNQQAEANANVEKLRQVTGDLISIPLTQVATPAVDLVLEEILKAGENK